MDNILRALFYASRSISVYSLASAVVAIVPSVSRADCIDPHRPAVEQERDVIRLNSYARGSQLCIVDGFIVKNDCQSCVKGYMHECGPRGWSKTYRDCGQDNSSKRDNLIERFQKQGNSQRSTNSSTKAQQSQFERERMTQSEGGPSRSQVISGATGGPNQTTDSAACSGANADIQACGNGSARGGICEINQALAICMNNLERKYSVCAAVADSARQLRIQALDAGAGICSNCNSRVSCASRWGVPG
ncbi:MAG: hypothetical protein ABL865_02310, partial [Candidatus Nitrotoga sp.]